MERKLTFKQLAIRLCNCEAGKEEVNIAQMREILSSLCMMMNFEVMQVLLKQAIKLQK